MSADEVDGELPRSERPTLPAPPPPPRESGVRLRMERRAYAFATVDVVVCDLTRDRRCEGPANDDDPAATPAPSPNVRALR